MGTKKKFGAVALMLVLPIGATSCSQSSIAGPSGGAVESAVTTPGEASDGSARPETAASAKTLAVSSAVVDGWSSVTGYRHAETAVQRRIVQAASAANGQSSGQSMTTGPWLTDIASGDGERMRRALVRWANFVTGRTRGLTAAQVKEQMKGELTTYDAARRQMLVDRMVERWNFWSGFTGPMPFTMPPHDDPQVLAFMGIRKQCLEWVDTVAQNAGGRALNYSAAAVSAANVRAGMGLFNVGVHAMIIVDVEWRGGVAVRFKVAEANWGSGWMNPNGQVPWQRTVGVGRLVTPGYKIVSFE
jgi:hypothetical protein